MGAGGPVGRSVTMPLSSSKADDMVTLRGPVRRRNVMMRQETVMKLRMWWCGGELWSREAEGVFDWLHFGLPLTACSL